MYESSRVAAFRSVFSIIDPLVAVHLLQHAIQIFICLTITFLVHNMSLTELGLEPLYDCSRVREQKVFYLSHQKACEHIMHEPHNCSQKNSLSCLESCSLNWRRFERNFSHLRANVLAGEVVYMC